MTKSTLPRHSHENGNLSLYISNIFNNHLRLVLLLIFLLGLGLRLWGITYGFPHIWNIDEPALVRSAYSLRFNLNPGHFDWPHFYYYFNGLFYMIFYYARAVITKLGLKDFVELVAPIVYKDPTVFYLISRVINAIVGAFTVVVMFKTAKTVFPKSMAIIAALLIAILPYHVGESHKALLEPALVLTMLLVYLYSIKIIKNPTLKNYILAGVFIGLSTSIKYNGFLSAICIIVASIVAFRLNQKKVSIKFLIKALFISATVSVAIFFVTTPYALLDYKEFFRNDISSGAFWQFENIGKLPINLYLSSLWFNLVTKMPLAVTYPIWITGMVGLIVATIKKEYKLLPLSSFLIFYIVYTSSLERQPTHYFLPIFPLIIIFATYFLYFLKKYKSLFITLLSLVVFVALYGSIKTSYLYSQVDSRNLATDWISTNITGGTVFFDGEYKPLILNKNILLKSPLVPITTKKIFNTNPDYFIWTKYESSPEQEKYYSEIIGKIQLQEFYSKDKNLGPDIYIYKIIK